MRVQSPIMVFLSDGVTGNTPDFDSGKSRFEPWWDNFKNPAKAGFLIYQLRLIARRFLKLVELN
jgi:hypothetical protein